MVVGSVAAAIHGYVRTTSDIDIVVEPSPGAVRRFVAALDEESFYADVDVALDAVKRGSQFNVIEFETGWKVDFIVLPDGEFDREQLAHAGHVDLSGVRVGVASVEATIIAKLRWAQQSSSARQREDVDRLVALHRDSLDRALLERWARLAGVEGALREVFTG